MSGIKCWNQLLAVPGLSLGVLLGGLNLGQSTVLTVRQDGTGNYTSIQACVNAMAPGDTCLVGPGVYAERITVPAGKSGQAGQLTMIEAETQGAVDTQGFDTGNNDYLLIQGFNISAPPSQTGLDAAGIVLQGNHLEIISNYIHDVYLGMWTVGYQNNVHISGNRLYRPGEAITMYGYGWLVEGNEIERLQKYAALGDADYLIFFGANHVIRSNYFHGTLQSEIGDAHVDGFSSWDNDGDFIQHIRIEANRVIDFYHQGFIAAAAYYSNSYDIVICNNLFRGAAAWGVDAFNGLRDVKVYNNIFMDINSSGVGINQGATGEVKNNIFYNVTGWDSATPASIGTKNIWYRPGGSVGARFIGDILNVDPQFVDVANTNFHLQAGSPAIDAGVSLPAVPYDMDSVARPQGAGWDIGAYEFYSGNPITNAPVVFSAQPHSRTNTVGSSATFGASAVGTAPLAFQWLLNGVSLANSTRISGASSNSLNISNVQLTDAGNYALVVSNIVGSVTSSVATLTVLGQPGNCLPPPAALVGWWPGDGDANDIAGANNGALAGGATAGAAGMVGSAFSFNGLSSYVQIPDSPSLHPTNLTIETWVRFDALDTPGLGGSPAGDQYLVFKQNSRSTDFEGFDLRKTRISGGDIFVFTVTSAAGLPAQAVSTTHIAIGQWYHLAAVRGATFIQLYVNGQLESQTSVGFPQDYGNLPLFFATSGESYWDHKLAGSLDEVSLYNRALSAGEIAAIYSARAAGKCKGATAPVPRFLTPVKQNGKLSFTFLGETGRTYSIETASDLQHWSSLTNVTLTNGAAQLSQPMLAPSQFFRARLLP